MGLLSLTTAGGRGVAILLLSVAAAGAGPRPDLLAEARRFYNQGQYDQAFETAKTATAPGTLSSARLIMARARLERFRKSALSTELDDAREDFRQLDPHALDARERIELQIGMGELLFLDDRFGPAAELLEPVVDSSASLAPDAHDRALDWWASALDRLAQTLAPPERALTYRRIILRVEQELQRDPGSAPASYWLAAATRAAGDLDRAWAAATAGWIRAPLGHDRGEALRADLDRLMTQAIIPDRSGRLQARDRQQAAATMTAEWEAFKKIW